MTGDHIAGAAFLGVLIVAAICVVVYGIQESRQMKESVKEFYKAHKQFNDTVKELSLTEPRNPKDTPEVHLLKHFQVTLDDWGAEHGDQRFRWSVWDKRSDREQLLHPLTDWSEVVGVGVPYMLGNEVSAMGAYEAATQWMADHPDLVRRSFL